MRLFLAVFPSKEILGCFVSIQENLKHYHKYIRIIPSDQIHMTIRFLGGEVSEDSYTQIIAALENMSWNILPIPFLFDEVRFGFSGRKIPRILFVSIKRSESLEGPISNINKTIQSLNLKDIQDVNFEVQILHFTLARRKGYISKEIIQNIQADIKKIDLHKGGTLERIDLVQSTLTPIGPDYKILQSYSLVAK